VPRFFFSRNHHKEALHHGITIRKV
jgi:hypothetical protein